MPDATWSRIAAFTALLLLVAAAAPARRAAADPACGYGPAPRCGCGHDLRCDGRGWGRRSHGACLDGVHVSRFLARGQGWSLLRRHLVRLRVAPTHRHPRSYFLRRWPCGSRDVPRAWGGRTCVGHDSPSTECPLVLAALGKLDADPAAEAAADTPVEELSRADRLARGMERFYRSAWDLAAADFRVAAEEEGDDARPVWGLALCDVMRKRWSDATGHLRRLVELDALRGDDLLDLEGAFEDAKSFERLRRGLVDLVKWSFHETDAQVVAAWACALTGERNAARGHVRAALRFAPKDVVARHLDALLGGRPAADAEVEPAEAPPAEAPRVDLTNPATVAQARR